MAAVFGPLYFAAYPERTGNVYLLTIAVVLIFKVWNLIANWWMLKLHDAGVRRIDLIVRLTLNCAVFYFLIHGDMILAAAVTLLFIVLFLYDYSISRKKQGLAWDLLVEKDQHRMQFFYRFANMFTDVSHLKNKVKKRHWLVSLFQRVRWGSTSTYDYLYRITFLRSSDYLGMYVRLTVIGGLFIYFVPDLWMKLLFALLFLYMSSFQLMTLYSHHRTVIWLDLYPVKVGVRQRAFLKWIFQQALVQTILFAAVFLLSQNYTGFVIVLPGGVFFNILFIHGYVKKKIT
jgi:ABC-2 type transport system permease protein